MVTLLLPVNNPLNMATIFPFIHYRNGSENDQTIIMSFESFCTYYHNLSGKVALLNAAQRHANKLASKHSLIKYSQSKRLCSYQKRAGQLFHPELEHNYIDLEEFHIKGSIFGGFGSGSHTSSIIDAPVSQTSKCDPLWINHPFAAFVETEINTSSESTFIGDQNGTFILSIGLSCAKL